VLPRLTANLRLALWTELDCLRNLRELRADGNKIKSIDGLQKLESLVKLSLQSNQIRKVDLTGYRWYVSCLVAGDHCADDELQANIRNVEPEPEPFRQHPGLKAARGIDRFESRYVPRSRGLSLQFCVHCSSLHLNPWAGRRLLSFWVISMMYFQALTAIHTDNNGLSELGMEAGDGGDSGRLGKLRILRVSGNRLQRLDGECFPNLRTLYADNNALTGISHCGRMRRLENLSLRNQAKGKL